ncbi:hypothetical protein [Fundidesulfovibrio putealis]|uniref:hypothetical protein n=1 Tax=Fundidesulfovibrio putealis TaxID=270496 RepID=UPI0004275EC9|nr:hypothetical protein [Fundidesulfovibrio putealis]
MHRFHSLLAAMAVSACVWLPAPASAQAIGVTVVGAPDDTVTARPVIGTSRYVSNNPVTYAKTATGLLVVLSPGELDGIGRLDGVEHGLTLEIPDFIFRLLFF